MGDRHMIQSHTVRMPERLKQYLFDQAVKKDTTLNAEIVDRLEQTRVGDQPLSEFPTSDVAEAWARNYLKMVLGLMRQEPESIRVVSREDSLDVFAYLASSIPGERTAEDLAARVLFLKQPSGAWVCEKLTTTL